MVEVGRHHSKCPVHPFAQAELVRAMPHLVLNVSKDRDSTNFPGQPMPVFDHLHSEKVTFMSSVTNCDHCLSACHLVLLGRL